MIYVRDCGHSDETASRGYHINHCRYCKHAPDASKKNARASSLRDRINKQPRLPNGHLAPRIES